MRPSAASELHQEIIDLAIILQAEPVMATTSATVSDHRYRKTLHNKLSLQTILREADVELDGNRPWDIEVRDERFYDRVFREGDMGVGESYVAGWWDCGKLDELTEKVLKHDLYRHRGVGWRNWLLQVRMRWWNLQSPSRAPQVARAHYDRGNDFFKELLGPTMAYSCADWSRARSLEQAQQDKSDVICRKLQLRRGQKLLDIGCGWGGLARHAAMNYGCHVTGITISKAQEEYAEAMCRDLPVRILCWDYRDGRLASLGPFDRIVSVGMFEHVGWKNYRRYMSIVRGLLEDGGLFLLHTIGVHRPSTVGFWLEQNIFPNSQLPRMEHMVRAIDERFVMEDWQNMGADYDRTLMAWHANLDRYADRHGVSRDAAFYRRWAFYLLTCAGLFRVRNRAQLWQIVMSKEGHRHGYRPVR
jgi:cyclopropane-fatty-acyl-phospholipid synthase